MFYKVINSIKNSPFAQDSFWAIFGSTLGKALSLLSGIVIARFLGKTVYGEFGTMRTTLIYIAVVSTLGFGYTATKFIVEYVEKQPDKLQSLISIISKVTLFVSTFLAIIQFVFAEQIAIFINLPNLKSILQIFSPLIIFNAYVSTQIAILSGLKLFKVNAIVNGVSGIVVFIASVVLTYYFGLEGALAALAISFIVQAIMNQYYIIAYTKKYKLVEHVTRKEIVSILKFTTPIALQESLYIVVHWLSLLILIRFSDYGQVGLSSAAGMWLSVVIFIPAMMKNVMFSYLSNTDNHRTMVKKLLLLNLLSSLMPAIFVSIFSSFISSFYGDSFTELPRILSVSVISAVFISVSEVLCYELISINKPWFVFLCRLIRDTLILLLAYLIIQNLSSNQALAWALISLLGNIIFLIVLYFIHKFTDVSK